MNLNDLLSNNPYFSAGFGLIGIGAAATVGRKLFQFGTVYARRKLLVSIEMPSKDKSYQWFLKWMSSNGIIQLCYIFSFKILDYSSI